MASRAHVLFSHLSLFLQPNASFEDDLSRNYMVFNHFVFAGDYNALEGFKSASQKKLSSKVFFQRKLQNVFISINSSEHSYTVCLPLLSNMTFGRKAM